MQYTQEEFERLIIQAVAELPVYFQEKLENIEILAAKWPSRQEMHHAGSPPGSLLLGLYQGIPLTERTHYYNLVPPDTITLYQGPIERVAGPDRARIRDQVRQTVIHEIAHHFGISDDRLHELGAY